MKRTLIISIVIASFNCYAQSPIFPLNHWSEEEPNAYYKDLDNELNAFVGTWLYTNGNTSWKMELKKEEMFYNGKYFYDLIGGEYQYIKNGNEFINTLSNLNSVEGWNHKIDGCSIYKDCDYLPPSDCIDGENRLIASLSDPITGHTATIILHKRIINEQEAILAYVIFNQLSTYDGQSEPKPEPTMPWQQEYILIKQ